MARAVTLRLGMLLVAAMFAIRPAGAADSDLDQCKARFRAGEYDKVVEQATAALKERQRNEEWQLLQARALWMTGRYLEAKEAITAAHRYNYYSVRLRLLAYQIHRSAGDLETAARMLDEINALGGSRRWGYREPLDLVALGEAAVILGADPKLVLENLFNPVKKNQPDLREVYLAIGHLALQKHDYALASKSFQEGLQKHRDDPDLFYGLAAALLPSDRKEMLKALEKVFEVNENHVEGRLLLAEHLVDAEEYAEAEKQLDNIRAVNPNHPEMWAYRSVIAHLRNDPESEESARANGLKFWTNNPVVDHIIGRKLSQKYRFAEGEARQRRALEFDAAYLPAKIQLAQDLLRLGQEEEGWRLAEQVAKADAYDVSAYNLVTLHDTIAKFLVLTNEHFILRMAPEEAAIYGKAALDLLEKARAQLTAKYGLENAARVTVEIFPRQKDFAVRTFGMPGGEGYLGVCFGNVITANSPASHEMNWHSVLWHEFCHVVTLNLTRNRMPRWLSEGISVYEERRADPRWGEQLNPRYWEFITSGKMTPIADLSSAFMAPPTGEHMQFAYYQSSLVVEFLIEKFGLEKLKAILADLGRGAPINDALQAHTAPLEALQDGFEKFAEGIAASFGTKSVWDKPKRDEDGKEDPAWAILNPGNYWVLKTKAEDLIERQDLDGAVTVLEKLIEIYPRQGGLENGYLLLAEIHRKRKDAGKEREVLRRWARHDGDAAEALLRLLELDRVEKDFRSALTHATLLLQVNPLHPLPHLALAEAREEIGNDREAVDSYETVLRLDPADRAEVHYRLARLLKKQGDHRARRHVLLALEEAPRFRGAHELLLELIEAEKESR